MRHGLAQLTRQSILSALDEFQRLGRAPFLEKYGFGTARDYFVRHPVTGMLADSKAVVGAAYRIQYPGENLHPSDFSGGLATVVTLLRSLDFEVVQSTHAGTVSTSSRSRLAWTRNEVELLVADYLQMLAMELTGQSYNKARRRRELQPLLNGRSEASIEFKRRNVSAVMSRLGMPRIRGYVPAENTEEELLLAIVANQLASMPLLDQAAEAAVQCPALEPESVDFSKVISSLPQRRNRVAESTKAYPRSAVRRDYIERESRNRTLGIAGEKFILDFERWRLLRSGLGQLADRVEHKSVTEGDGLGYDVLSFDVDGQERFIEVKTTAFSEETPFFVTANELAFARTEPQRFRLCRVFDFRSSPRFFELAGPVEQHFYLDPATYRASLQ